MTGSRAQTTQQTDVTFNVSALSPWQDGDELQLASVQGATWAGQLA